ncbi:MAG: hypothetical protein KQH83_11575 [Actinobacteria bacterium]|nr:hypothetical protein [Actinomycetota bacterium]
MKTRLALLAAACLAASACSSGGVLIITTTSGAPATTAAPSTTSTTTTTIPRDCAPAPEPLPEGLVTTDPAAVSLALSQATFPCAEEVTVAPAGDPTAARRAALHAAAAGGPLLLAAGDAGSLAAEIARLDPALVTVAGPWAHDDPAFGGRAVAALDERLGIRGGIAQGASDASRLLVVGEGAAASWPAVWAAARAAGDTAVLAASADLRALPDAQTAALRSTAAPANLLGTGDDAAWQLAAVRSGSELPGGGLLLFPGRRLVAFYGHPQTGVLGVLGEQGIDGAAATIERMLPIVAEYGSDGVTPVPAFEIIATVASAEATSDGDYSRETPLDVLRPWVEAAGEAGVYVILDLQPGRTDFLTQAELYEEFVRLPHVGIAIDPEWRLEPWQVHQQIGSVDAAEINEVAAWMAGIVREEGLPQKLLLLHQFRPEMIPDRDAVELHPELAIAVQMDGHGVPADKHATWGRLTGAPDAGRLWWGWKNFYDEDAPMATPQQVLDLEPTVYLVSFQ